MSSWRSSRPTLTRQTGPRQGYSQHASHFSLDPDGRGLAQGVERFELLPANVTSPTSRNSGHGLVAHATPTVSLLPENTKDARALHKAGKALQADCRHLHFLVPLLQWPSVEVCLDSGHRVNDAGPEDEISCSFPAHPPPSLYPSRLHSTELGKSAPTLLPPHRPKLHAKTELNPSYVASECALDDERLHFPMSSPLRGDGVCDRLCVSPREKTAKVLLDHICGKVKLWQVLVAVVLVRPHSHNVSSRNEAMEELVRRALDSDKGKSPSQNLQHWALWGERYRLD